ncbi:DHHC palmitoyltransferase-domain-containing protein [Chiua virens]|nr:DHHC palmitoyltransferase-domain-containing protein [Chiua virens]
MGAMLSATYAQAEVRVRKSRVDPARTASGRVRRSLQHRPSPTSPALPASSPRYPPMPLLSFDFSMSTRDPSTLDDEDEPPKRWYHYLPLFGRSIASIAPHPSWLLVLVNHYLRSQNSTSSFFVHLAVSYTLAFLAFCSLIVCVARDPGPVTLPKGTSEEETDDLGLQEALIATPDFDDELTPLKWCRTCWGPKPERAHHCNICGRCVLKMDHHCPWLGGKCVGHRTYPAFFHFISCVTLLSTYIGVISARAFWWSLHNPTSVPDDTTPIHELLLTAAGFIFAIVVGSFTIYHMYLISTNQTTLESLSPFLLLRYLPPLPASLRLSDPPMEHELSYKQRCLVRDAHSSVKLYNIGWRRNWAQVFEWNKPRGWICRLIYGGASRGDGQSFPRNPRADEMLSRLAERLATVDKEA